MFVQTHFQRSRHLAAGSASSSTCANSAITTPNGVRQQRSSSSLSGSARWPHNNQRSSAATSTSSGLALPARSKSSLATSSCGERATNKAPKRERALSSSPTISAKARTNVASASAASSAAAKHRPFETATSGAIASGQLTSRQDRESSYRARAATCGASELRSRSEDSKVGTPSSKHPVPNKQHSSPEQQPASANGPLAAGGCGQVHATSTSRARRLLRTGGQEQAESCELCTALLASASCSFAGRSLEDSSRRSSEAASTRSLDDSLLEPGRSLVHSASQVGCSLLELSERQQTSRPASFEALASSFIKLARRFASQQSLERVCQSSVRAAPTTTTTTTTATTTRQAGTEEAELELSKVVEPSWLEHLLLSSHKQSKLILVFCLSFIAYQLESFCLLARALFTVSRSATARKAPSGAGELASNGLDPCWALHLNERLHRPGGAAVSLHHSCIAEHQELADGTYGVVDERAWSRRQMAPAGPTSQTQRADLTHGAPLFQHTHRHKHDRRQHAGNNYASPAAARAMPTGTADANMSHAHRWQWHLRHTVDGAPVVVPQWPAGNHAPISNKCPAYMASGERTAEATPGESNYAEMRTRYWQQQQRAYSLAQRQEWSPVQADSAQQQQQYGRHLERQSGLCEQDELAEAAARPGHSTAVPNRSGLRSHRPPVNSSDSELYTRCHRLAAQPAGRLVLEACAHNTSYIHHNHSRHRHSHQHSHQHHQAGGHSGPTPQPPPPPPPSSVQCEAQTGYLDRSTRSAGGSSARTMAPKPDLVARTCSASTTGGHSQRQQQQHNLLITPLGKVSLAGAKRRLGFKQKSGLNSLNVQRSEEIVPDEWWARAGATGSQRRYATATNSVNSSSVDEQSAHWLAQHQHQLGYRPLTQSEPNESSVCFVDGLGIGQIASRQALVAPYLGDVQLSIGDQRGMLEVEVIRARRLQYKACAKRLPSPSVKVYLMRDKKCLAKFRTEQARRTLEPIYQQRFIFRDNYSNCVLQVIVWGDYGKKDRKSFMGAVQVHLDDLDLSGELIVGWYKLFNALSVTSALSSSSSKALRQTLSSAKIDGRSHSTEEERADEIEARLGAHA